VNIKKIDFKNYSVVLIMTYIYAHFFSNGDKYVGISNNPEQRWEEGFDSNNAKQYNHKVLIANEKYDKLSLIISENLPRRIAEAMEAMLITKFYNFNLNIKEEIVPNLHGNNLELGFDGNFLHVYPIIDGEVSYYSSTIGENNGSKLIEVGMGKIKENMEKEQLGMKEKEEKEERKRKERERKLIALKEKEKRELIVFERKKREKEEKEKKERERIKARKKMQGEMIREKESEIVAEAEKMAEERYEKIYGKRKKEVKIETAKSNGISTGTKINAGISAFFAPGFLGIVGLVLLFIFPPLGFILLIIAFVLFLLGYNRDMEEKLRKRKK